MIKKSKALNWYKLKIPLSAGARPKADQDMRTESRGGDERRTRRGKGTRDTPDGVVSENEIINQPKK